MKQAMRVACVAAGMGAVVAAGVVSPAPAHAATDAAALSVTFEPTAPAGYPSSDHGGFMLTSPVLGAGDVGRTLVFSITGVTGAAAVDTTTLSVSYVDTMRHAVPMMGVPMVTGATAGVKVQVTQAMVGHQVQFFGQFSSPVLITQTVPIVGRVILHGHTWTQTGALTLAVLSASMGSDMGIAVPSTDIMWKTDAERNQILDQVKATGAQYVRIDVAMSQLTWIDPATGKPFYDWNTLDKTVAAVKAHGLTMVGILQTLSDYALPANQRGMNRTGPTTPAELDAFNTYVRNVVSHVGTDVNDWEIWNEENLVNFWGGGSSNNPSAPAPTAAAYAKLLATVTPTIRSINPHATIITGGTGGAGGDAHDVDAVQYVGGLYAVNANSNFDALAIHAYTNASNNTLGEFERLGAYRQIMDSHGDARKQLWITEAGTKVAEKPGDQLATEAQQADMEPRMAAAWSSVHDHGPMMVFSMDDDVDSGFGLLRVDGSARPALSALTAVMSQKLS